MITNPVMLHVEEPHSLNEINSEKIGWFKLVNLVDVYVKSGEKSKEWAQSGGSGWKNQSHSSLQRSYSILTDWWSPLLPWKWLTSPRLAASTTRCWTVPSFTFTVFNPGNNNETINEVVACSISFWTNCCDFPPFTLFFCCLLYV